jgi:hypothetical protein
MKMEVSALEQLQSQEIQRKKEEAERLEIEHNQLTAQVDQAD